MLPTRAWEQMGVPQFDLTPPSKDELRVLVADLSDDERHVLLEHGTEAPFCGVFLEENGRERTPADCVDCRCSKPARNSKAALDGRASLVPFQKTTSDPFATPVTV